MRLTWIQEHDTAESERDLYRFALQHMQRLQFILIRVVDLVRIPEQTLEKVTWAILLLGTLSLSSSKQQRSVGTVATAGRGVLESSLVSWLFLWTMRALGQSVASSLSVATGMGTLQRAVCSVHALRRHMCVQMMRRDWLFSAPRLP